MQMSENVQSKKDNKIYKRPSKFSRKKKYFLIIFSLCVFFALIFVLYKTSFAKSLYDKLDSIDASRAIPDSENAAIIYNQMFEDYNEIYFKPDFLTPEIDTISKTSPWSSQDYPELSSWLEQNKDIIPKLFEISKYEKCFYPLSKTFTDIFVGSRKHLSPTRESVFFLIRSANNDIAENRIDQALEKYLCGIRIGRHFQQQPIGYDFTVGMTIEILNLQRILYLVVNEDLTNEHLKTIEAIIPNTKLNKYYNAMLETEKINSEIIYENIPEKFKLLKRIIRIFTNTSIADPTLRLKDIYSRFLTVRKGTQIIIALRYYKNKNGEWPETLEEIKPFLSSEEILIDSINEKPFRYGRLISGSFYLHDSENIPIWPVPVSN